MRPKDRCVPIGADPLAQRGRCLGVESGLRLRLHCESGAECGTARAAAADRARRRRRRRWNSCVRTNKGQGPGLVNVLVAATYISQSRIALPGISLIACRPRARAGDQSVSGSREPRRNGCASRPHPLVQLVAAALCEPLPPRSGLDRLGHVRRLRACGATVGHIHGFGSTEEEYEELVFGVQGKGKKGDPPFDHATRNGWLKHKDGQYYDALPRVASRMMWHSWLRSASGPLRAHAAARRARRPTRRLRRPTRRDRRADSCCAGERKPGVGWKRLPLPFHGSVRNELVRKKLFRTLFVRSSRSSMQPQSRYHARSSLEARSSLPLAQMSRHSFATFA